MGTGKKYPLAACESRRVMTLFFISLREKTRPQAATSFGPIWPGVYGFGGTPTSNFSEFPATEILAKFASVYTLALLALSEPLQNAHFSAGLPMSVFSCAD